MLMEAAGGMEVAAAMLSASGLAVVVNPREVCVLPKRRVNWPRVFR